MRASSSCRRARCDATGMLTWPWGITYGSILGVDEHPFATYFDVHQGYRVLSHSKLNIYFNATKSSG